MEQQPRRLADILSRAMPSAGKGRLPSPELIADWRKAAGEEVARRARPVCLQHDGVLVVAVAGSVWRQEISMAAPRLARDMAERGHAVTSLKVVQAATAPPSPRPRPEVKLGPEDLAVAEAAVASAADPGLRQALARAVRAQITAQKAKGLDQD